MSLVSNINSFYELILWLDGKESTCNAGDTTDVGSIPGQEGPLEEEMAPHSSILAWKIPRAEEAGGLQSMGLPRVEHA